MPSRFTSGYCAAYQSSSNNPEFRSVASWSRWIGLSTLELILDVDSRLELATFVQSVDDIMAERIHPVADHISILFQIGFRVEEALTLEQASLAPRLKRCR